MMNVITRSAVLITALGFLFGCSLLNQTNDFEDAKTLTEQRSLNEALFSAQRAINSDPTNYQAHFLKGDIIYQLSKSYVPADRNPLYKDMVNAFDAAILNAPVVEAESIAQQANMFIQSAYDYEFQNANNILSSNGEENGDLAIQNAIIHLENAAIIQKSSIEVYELLFDLYTNTNNSKKAAEQLNKLAGYTELSPLQNETLGYLMFEQGNFPVARIHLEEAWMNGNGSLNSGRGLVNTYSILGMEDEAYNIVLQLIDAGANDITTLLAYANILITKTLDSLTEVSISRTNDLAALQFNVAKLNMDEAKENLTMALDIDSQDLMANYLAGYFYMELGYWFDTIRTTQPGLFTQSEVEQQSTDSWYQSINYLETVIEIDSEFNDAWKILWPIYDKLGMTEEAERARNNISS